MLSPRQKRSTQMKTADLSTDELTPNFAGRGGFFRGGGPSRNRPGTGRGRPQRPEINEERLESWGLGPPRQTRPLPPSRDRPHNRCDRYDLSQVALLPHKTLISPVTGENQIPFA